MQKLKKLILLLTTATLAVSALAFASCKDPDNSSSSSSSSIPGGGEYEYPALKEDCEHEFDEWTFEKEANCVQDGFAYRYCLLCKGSQTETIPMRGHTFNNTACEKCDTPIQLPTEDNSLLIQYPQEDDSGIAGTGEAYDRYELKEGYIELTGGRLPIWLSFSVSGAGQYVLYTVEGDQGATITRYDASFHTITESSAQEATLVDGNLRSVVNCGSMYYSTQWRATYRVNIPNGVTVKLRFTYLSTPVWSPSYVYTNVYATQIDEEAKLEDANGKKKYDGEEYSTPVDVPYNSAYFYDESVGFYRMGTKNDPGEIIYVAITKTATRLFENSSFVQIQAEGNNLALGNGLTFTGDYNIEFYGTMLMSNFGDTSQEGDPNAYTYDNYVNSDGMYPVNQELYNFLTVFTANHTPNSWNSAYPDANKWLAPCYYYTDVKAGTQNNPLILNDGVHTVSIEDLSILYCSFVPTVKDSGDVRDEENVSQTTQSTVYTIECNAEGVLLKVNGKNYAAPCKIYVDASSASVALMVYTSDFSKKDNVEISIENTLGSHSDYALALPEIDENGNVTLTPMSISTADGILYYAYYELLTEETYSFSSTVNGITVNGEAISETATAFEPVVLRYLDGEDGKIPVYGYILFVECETETSVTLHLQK